ncbi:MAG: prepilin peptidase, partial [Oligoflexus sp.]
MQASIPDLTLVLQSPLTYFWASFGALMGSFFNVCIYRIPRKIFWQSSRSMCPHCGTAIPFWHNIPLLSWLILRGRAACCQGRISVQYPLVELGTALLFASVYWCFPFIQRWDGQLLVDSSEVLRFGHALVFTSLLLICSVIDLEHQIIPDVLSLPMIAATPLVIYLHPDLDWKSGLLGVLLGGGVFYAIAWIYYLIRKESGLGMGDVKLLAAIGGWLGYQSILTTVFWASILGSLVGIGVIILSKRFDMKTRIPFGP